jgi:hypothetical protein
MKNISSQLTIRLFAALLWLALAPTAGRLAAQPHSTAEEALEAAENQAADIHLFATRGLNLLPQLAEALEDGDFRAQQPLFRKMHVILNDIEDKAIALSRSIEEAGRLDPRLDLKVIRDAAIYIGTNEDYIALSLLEVAQALHEGDLALAESAMNDAGNALRAIGAFARVAEDETRQTVRSL